MRPGNRKTRNQHPTHTILRARKYRSRTSRATPERHQKAHSPQIWYKPQERRDTERQWRKTSTGRHYSKRENPDTRQSQDRWPEVSLIMVWQCLHSFFLSLSSHITLGGYSAVPRVVPGGASPSRVCSGVFSQRNLEGGVLMQLAHAAKHFLTQTEKKTIFPEFYRGWTIFYLWAMSCSSGQCGNSDLITWNI